LRLNFAVTDERLARVKESGPFAALAATKKRKDTKGAQEEIEAGKKQQARILATLKPLSAQGIVKNRASFHDLLTTAFGQASLKVPGALFKAILAALSERDDAADVCTDADGNPEPDPDLRDYENVPLKEDVGEYMRREVLPHVPDAWVDESKTRIGYEINFNRYFYKYTPPRPLEEIEADLKKIEKEIADMLTEVTE
jgi:type I restriction enzyme M protein